MRMLYSVDAWDERRAAENAVGQYNREAEPTQHAKLVKPVRQSRVPIRVIDSHRPATSGCSVTAHAYALCAAMTGVSTGVTPLIARFRLFIAPVDAALRLPS